VTEAILRDDVPLVVDLDGTLHMNDISLLLFLSGCRRNPLLPIAFLLLWCFKGKGFAKVYCQRFSRLHVAQLHWCPDVIEHVRQAKSQGRVTVLATGTPQQAAEACNAALNGLFDVVIGTQPDVNLVGAAKAFALVSKYGHDGFDYIGNSAQDLQVWCVCRKVLIAYARPRVARQARALGKEVAGEFF